MEKDLIIKTAYERGFFYEKNYHGCAQSTIAAVQDAFGIRNDFIFKTGSGLAGGMGSLGDGICGGYTGGGIMISTFFGRTRNLFNDDEESKRCSSFLVRELHQRFLEKYGSVICRDIQKKIFGRSYNLWDENDKIIFEKDGAHIDKCTKVVGDASSWAAELILQEMEKRGVKIDDFKYLNCVLD